MKPSGSASETAASGGLPPLEDGDRLTRHEFERRFDSTPNLKIVELIEGVVRVPRTGSVAHGSSCFDTIGWLGQYLAATSGIGGGAHGYFRLDLNNMPQPDAYLMILPVHGGQVRVDEDGCVAAAPELVTEVTDNSVNYDLHDKLDVYRRNGVREYVVWRMLDEAVDWFVLRDGRYEPMARDEAGIYKSEVFPGLWLDAAALLRGDLATVFQVLQQGLASPEHTEFVDRLRQAAAGH